MFQNTHIWDLWLRASSLEFPNEQKFPIISGTSIQGNVRSFVEAIGEWQNVSKALFGGKDFPSSILFSDLYLNPN